MEQPDPPQYTQSCALVGDGAPYAVALLQSGNAVVGVSAPRATLEALLPGLITDLQLTTG